MMSLVGYSRVIPYTNKKGNKFERFGIIRF